MILVSITGPQSVAKRLKKLGNGLQSEFRFSTGRHGVPLHLDPAGCGSPFQSCREYGLTVSAWHCEGIATYLRQPAETHLLTLSMLGLLQWRALMGNAVLRPEDFHRQTACGCLFEERSMSDGYALLLDRPHLCAYCELFYAALCPKAHLKALHSVLHHNHAAAGDGCAA